MGGRTLEIGSSGDHTHGDGRRCLPCRRKAVPWQGRPEDRKVYDGHHPVSPGQGDRNSPEGVRGAGWVRTLFRRSGPQRRVAGDDGRAPGKRGRHAARLARRDDRGIARRRQRGAEALLRTLPELLSQLCERQRLSADQERDARQRSAGISPEPGLAQHQPDEYRAGERVHAPVPRCAGRENAGADRVIEGPYPGCAPLGPERAGDPDRPARGCHAQGRVPRHRSTGSHCSGPMPSRWTRKRRWPIGSPPRWPR